MVNEHTSGVVGVSDGHSVAGQLVSVGSGQDEVSLDLGVHNLADGVLVGLCCSKRKKTMKCIFLTFFCQILIKSMKNEDTKRTTSLYLWEAYLVLSWMIKAYLWA